MFGLEDDKKLFEFDLEKDMKKNPQGKKNMLDLLDKEMVELKNSMRDCDPKSKDFNDMGTLIHGYEAARKVLSQL